MYKKQGMRTLTRAIGMLLICGVAATSMWAADLSASITQVSGKVEVQSAQGWIPAKVGLTITANTVISTGFRSEAVLQIGPSVVTVKALSRISLQELAESEGLLSTTLTLKVGAIKADVRPAPGGAQQLFTVQSAISTASVRGTNIDFDGQSVTENDSSGSHTVILSDANGVTVTVTQGEQAQVTLNASTSPLDNRQISQNNATTNVNPNSVFVPPTSYSQPTTVAAVTYGTTPNFEDVTADIITIDAPNVIINISQF